jgi:F0F1-type ATP synthase delta subunit
MKKEYGEFYHFLTIKDSDVFKVYTELMNKINEHEHVKMLPKKTFIQMNNSKNGLQFIRLEFKKEYLKVKIYLNKELESERIKKIKKEIIDRHEYTINLYSIVDIDKELIGWLKEAYNYTTQFPRIQA